MKARAKLLSVLAALVGGGAALLASTQTWIVAILAEVHGALEVTGTVAAPLTTPLSFAALALGLALTVVGPIMRYVFGALAVAIGVGIAAASWGSALDPPVSAVAVAVEETTGLAGNDAVRELVTSLTATAWPFVSLVSGVVIAFAGVLVLLTARSWPRAGRRYDAPTTAAPASRPHDAIDSWDDLSRGDDPTR